jgi:hypothetical protein
MAKYVEKKRVYEITYRMAERISVPRGTPKGDVNPGNEIRAKIIQRWAHYKVTKPLPAPRLRKRDPANNQQLLLF